MQRRGGLSVERRVVEHRVLKQHAAGPARRGLPLGRPSGADVGHVQEARRAGKLLDRPGRPEQRRADVVIDVVEGVTPLAVMRPVLRRAV